MDPFSRELNGLLVDTFQSILKVEERALRQLGQTDLSMSELHLLEAVGKDKRQGRTISDIAMDQKITLPSVTVGINKLVKKGYVEKLRCEKDARRVYVKLTRLGRKVNAGHQYFHENMVRNVTDQMDGSEREALVAGVSRLNEFFKKRLEAEEIK